MAFGISAKNGRTLVGARVQPRKRDRRRIRVIGFALVTPAELTAVTDCMEH